VEPSPSFPEDSTPIPPPCSSTSRLQIASPRPRPPYPSAAVRSDCRNSSKMATCSSGGMPSPVSCTVTRTCPPVAVAARVTCPWLVNLIALLTRFNATCRRRARSPHTLGRLSAISARKPKPLSSASNCPIAATARKGSARSRGSHSSSRRPISLRVRSSTSQIKLSRCWALAYMRSRSSRPTVHLSLPEAKPSCRRISVRPEITLRGIRSS